MLTADRCPECGRDFDPGRPETMNLTGHRINAFARWLMRPPGWAFHLAVVFALCYPLWLLSYPGGAFRAGVLGAAMWFLVYAVWGVRYTMRFAVARYYGQPRCELRRSRWKWWIAPGLFLIYVAIPAHLPLRIAFSLSKGELERIVAQVQSDPTRLPSNIRAGFYTVRVQAFGPDGVWLFTDCGYDAHRCGFAWCATPPQDSGWSDHYPLTGKWYLYSDYEPYAPLSTTQPTTRPLWRR